MAAENTMTEEHGEQSQPGPVDKQGSPGAAAKLLRNLVFLPWVQYPPLPRVPDLSDPTSFKWNQGKDSAEEDDFDYDTSLVSHLFISSPVGTKDSTSRVGAWLMLPTSSSGKVETLKSSDTVILYLHGNASNRSQPHRIALYKVFLSLGYYVLAIDYRGFGDSSAVLLTEDTVVADARAALAWITAKLGEACKVVVWGHSLGTAISTHMVAEADMETGGNSSVRGLVLESPFNNMKEMVATYKITSGLISRVLDIDQLILDTGVEFATDRWLPAVRCPVLILHAEDDNIVPHRLGVALEASTREAGKQEVRLVSYPSTMGLGHCDIYKASSLPEEVQSFVERLQGEPTNQG